MSDFPFDIPTVQPSSGGGGLPHVAIRTESIESITNLPTRAGKLIPSFEILITPTSETQKVYLSGVINGCMSARPYYGFVVIYRNGVSLAPGNGAGGGTGTVQCNGNFLLSYPGETSTVLNACPFSVVDEPATTSEIKYEVYVGNNNPSGTNITFFLNRTISAGSDNYIKRLESSFSAQCF